MKKNLIFFSLLMILFSGCSKNDESATPEEEQEIEIPADEKLLNNISGELLLEYNDAGNIERIRISNNVLISYGYEGDKIITFDLYSQDGSINILLSYDANGRIDSFSDDDVITDVTYNEVNNYYFYKMENDDEVTLFLNHYGDITKLVQYDNGANETYTSTILYEDEDYNGTLTNTNNPIIQTMIGYPGVGFLLSIYNLSKKPVRTIAGPPFGLLNFQNTYDEQNFLETSTFGIDEPQTWNFDYFKLNP